MAFQDPLAFSTPETIRAEQTRLLNAHLQYARSHSPYYAALPGHPITLEELATLPVTAKADLANYNEQFFALPENKLADICFTSGTTGHPCRIAYSESDLERLALNDATGFFAAGIRPGSKTLLTCTVDRCFIAGLAYYSGCRKLGAPAIRNGLNSLESHADIFRRERPEAIVGVPSFLVRLGEFLETGNVDISCVETLVCIGESLRDAELKLTPLGERLERLWPGKSFSTYASSEIATSFTECSARRGGHAPSTLAIVEILDDAGTVLPPGETGEVTVTPLGVTGMPLVRFRTGDLGFLIAEKCSCGRNTVRLSPILGRKAQMLKVRGTTLFPGAFFSVLDECREVAEYFAEVSGDSLSDEVTLFVAAEKKLDLEKLRNAVYARTRVKVAVCQVGVEMARDRVFGRSRKATRFFDLRGGE